MHTRIVFAEMFLDRIPRTGDNFHMSTTSINEETTLQLAPKASHQALAGGDQSVAMSMDSGYLFSCNKTARLFLEALSEPKTLGAVVDQLHERFEVERDVLKSDMLALADQLLEEGLIIRVEH